MDTISREPNSNSYLPVAGLVVGVVALVLAFVALVKVSSVSKSVTAYGDQIDKIPNLESNVQSASASAEKAQADIKSLHDSTQDGFNTVATDLGNIHASITKLEESPKAMAKTSKSAKGAKEAKADEGAASDGSYVVKSGDTLSKIARATGVALADLEAANPGVDSKHLKVGQKLSLPAKK